MPCPICNAVHTESVEEALDRLQAGPARLQAALADASDTQLDAAPPTKWSARQIAVHLLDAEIVVASRVRKILSEEDGTLATMDQDRMAAACTAGGPLPHVLRTFEALRLDNVFLLRAALTAQPASFARTGVHPDFGRLSLSQIRKFLGRV